MSQLSVTAIDGKPLGIVGVAHPLIFHDTRVHLPKVSVEFLVVKNLGVVYVDLLIGRDIISLAGGVHLEYAENDRVPDTCCVW